jgi:hypothetical protein
MNPIVRLGLTQPKVQAVQGLQGVGLVIEEDKKQRSSVAERYNSFTQAVLV